MVAVLSKSSKDLTVGLLLDGLQQTKDFELSMAKKFAVPVRVLYLWRAQCAQPFIFS
jgi:hypothetical protein